MMPAQSLCSIQHTGRQQANLMTAIPDGLSVCSTVGEQGSHHLKGMTESYTAAIITAGADIADACYARHAPVTAHQQVSVASTDDISAALLLQSTGALRNPPGFECLACSSMLGLPGSELTGITAWNIPAFSELTRQPPTPARLLLAMWCINVANVNKSYFCCRKHSVQLGTPVMMLLRTHDCYASAM